MLQFKLENIRNIKAYKISYFYAKLGYFWEGRHKFSAESLWGRVSRHKYKLQMILTFSFLSLLGVLVAIPVVFVERITGSVPSIYFYVSLLLWGGSIYAFVRQRREGYALYHKFMAEVEERLAQGKSVQMDKEKNMLINKLIGLLQLRTLSLQVLALSMVSLGVYTYNANLIALVKKPQSLAKVMYERVRKSELSAQNIEHKLWKNKQVLNNTERLLKTHQKRLQEIQQSIYTHYANIREADGYRNKNRQISLQIKDKTPQEVEELFKQDAFMMTQLKGLVEMKLDLADRPIEQSASILGTEGNLIKEFYDLNLRYDQAVALGNHSIQKDYQALQQTQKWIEKDKQTLAQIKTAMQKDSATWHKLKKEWQNNKQLLRKVQIRP